MTVFLLSMKNKIKSDGSITAIYKVSTESKLSRPLLGTKVPAGFPSPASDYLEGTLDLNKYLIAHPASTFFMRVGGDSMIGAGIYPEDIVIVDRSLEATNNKIVVAVYDGELTLKRLRIENDKYYHVSENDSYPVIEVNKELDFFVWGIVTFVIHQV
ncbi:MAG TPA: translesion error-prone DNA polymerase V autoproteolytic subunit [Candidatus Syntrophosphaera thermopropionivorans]|nr:translesion error-prone DNA polymerase V autoproteolytic subunit [Candidatus Syntrophosphaera thermopropionivorans]